MPTAPLLERIAIALERQCAQHDEAMAHRAAMETAQLARLNAHRDADLARIRQEHAELLALNTEYARMVGELRDLVQAQVSSIKPTPR